MLYRQVFQQDMPTARLHWLQNPDMAMPAMHVSVSVKAAGLSFQLLQCVQHTLGVSKKPDHPTLPTAIDRLTAQGSLRDDQVELRASSSACMPVKA